MLCFSNCTRLRRIHYHLPISQVHLQINLFGINQTGRHLEDNLDSQDFNHYSDLKFFLYFTFSSSLLFLFFFFIILSCIQFFFHFIFDIDLVLFFLCINKFSLYNEKNHLHFCLKCFLLKPFLDYHQLLY